MESTSSKSITRARWEVSGPGGYPALYVEFGTGEKALVVEPKDTLLDRGIVKLWPDEEWIPKLPIVTIENDPLIPGKTVLEGFTKDRAIVWLYKRLQAVLAALPEGAALSGHEFSAEEIAEAVSMREES